MASEAKLKANEKYLGKSLNAYVVELITSDMNNSNSHKS